MKAGLLCTLLISLSFLNCSPTEKTAFLAGREIAWLKARNNTVIVATEFNYPPFAFVNDQGQFKGISADYLKLLEEKLPLHFEYLSPDHLAQQLTAVKTGRAQMICNLRETPERLQYLNFTPPYMEVPVVIITRNTTQGLSSLEGLRGRTVAVGQDYGVHEYLQAQQPDLNLYPVENDLIGLRQLSFGEIDAVVMDIASASYFIENETIVNLKITGELDFKYELCLAVHNTLPTLHGILVKGLHRITPKERDAIEARWIRLRYPLFWQRYRLQIFATAGGLLFIALWFLLLNLSLKRQVRLKTAALRNEIKERMQAEALLQALLEGRTESIWAIDSHYKIIALNHYFKTEFKTYYDIDLEVGMDALEVLPKRHQYDWKSLYDLALDGKNHHIEYAIPRLSPTRTFIVSLTPIRLHQNIIGASAISLDITKRKEAEAQIERDLHEKEVLLKEVHHRVKNNMNIVTSLLSLQAAHITTAKEALEAFEESKNRILSMALVHHLLYQSDDFSTVNMDDYIKNISRELQNAMTGEKKIKMELQLQGLTLDINTAVPCGLILNEWLTNAFKHAFSGRDSGTVRIAFTRDDAQQYVLHFSDDGIGLPPQIVPQTGETLGLRLISILAEQLEGTLAVNRDNGTAYSLTFPPPV